MEARNVITTKLIATVPFILATGGEKRLSAGTKVQAGVITRADNTDWIKISADVEGTPGAQTVKPVAASKYLETVPVLASVVPDAPAVLATNEDGSVTTAVKAAESRAAEVSFAPGFALKGERQVKGSQWKAGTELGNASTRGGDAPLTNAGFTNRDAIVHNEKVMRGLPNVSEVITTAGLNWTVSKHRLFMEVEGSKIEVPAASVMRDDTREVLGVVGPKYVPIQNAEGFALLDNLKAAGAEFVGAGSFGAGATVFVQMDLKNDRDIVPGDTVQQFILVRNSHDGTGSYLVKSTPVRVVCFNTLTHATFGEGNLFGKLRHTKNVSVKIEDIAKVLETLRKQQERAFDTYAALAKKGVTDTLISKVWEDIGVFQLPDDPSQKRARDNAIERRDEVMRLFEGDAKGNEIPGVKGTAWGFYNAVTEWADWSFAENARTDSARNESRMIGRAAQLKEDVLELMVSNLGISMETTRA